MSHMMWIEKDVLHKMFRKTQLSHFLSQSGSFHNQLEVSGACRNFSNFLEICYWHQIQNNATLTKN